jgi:sec-independent protein translocase protein TatA
MLHHVTTLGFLGNLHPMEMLFLGMIALLLFGKKLPEVAKSLGKGIVEFKKGLAGVEEDVKNSSSGSTRSTTRRPEAIDDEPIVSAPKFEPPKSEPAVASTTASQV